jgi:hypothetical protein
LSLLGTALDLLGHENWKVRGFAVRIIMNDIMRLFEKIYGKDPYGQVRALERRGLGSSRYKLVEVT